MRKLLCWLGFHKWQHFSAEGYGEYRTCRYCKRSKGFWLGKNINKYITSTVLYRLEAVYSPYELVQFDAKWCVELKQWEVTCVYRDTTKIMFSLKTFASKDLLWWSNHVGRPAPCMKIVRNEEG